MSVFVRCRARDAFKALSRPQAAKWKRAFTVTISELATRDARPDVTNPPYWRSRRAPRGRSRSRSPADGLVRNRQPIGAYEKCPRRFFYTHVLGLGGARKPTAFSRTHDCLYDLLRWLADARRSAEPSLGQAEAAFEAIWNARGPADHAFAAITVSSRPG